MKSSRLAALAATAVASVALAGPDWTEVGDAGSFLTTAQRPGGIGQIQSIAGSLGGRGGAADLEDCYIVRIDSPATFRLELANPGFDAQLFIFNITQADEAFGLLANDNGAMGSPDPVLTAVATDGTGASITRAGVYMVAVAGAGRMPTSLNGAIFDLQAPNEISGADGPGGLLPHTGWTGEGAVGGYAVMLEGTEFVDIPAPAAAAVLGFGALVSTRRRRA